MEDYVFISSVGNKHYITDNDLSIAYRDLLTAGYGVDKASELAIDICIGRIEATELDIKDFLYNNSRYASQLMLLANLNTKISRNTNDQS
jgi:hypothetical protein